MNVPFLDLARQNVALASELDAAAARVIRSTRVLYGPELEAFEAELAAWFGVKHAVGVASGTDAVEIALRCVGVGPGDTVTVPAFTAVPCANAVEATGADMRLMDVDTDANLRGLTDDKAVLAVSMFGNPADFTPGRALPPVVEDIAHAMGATIGGHMAGTRGAAGAVSFYPTKCLGTLGDGGAVITDNDEIARRARACRHYGFDGGNVRGRGQNSRLCEMQAAFLRVKLPHVHRWNARRQAIAARYNAELPRCVFPVAPLPGTGAVYHVYVVRHPERDRIRAALAERGIGTMIHYDRAIHQHERWRHLGFDGQFPHAEQLAREVLSLPCYPELREDEQAEVIAAVKEVT